MSTVISVEHLSKQYDLGVIGTGSLIRDFERWSAKARNKPDPYAIIGRETVNQKRGESILALDDVSFTVKQGEALGIIGRNGAGKSTLLKILSRVTAPTSGVVKVKGRIGSLLEVGTGFHPELTGRENVYLNGAIYGMNKEEVTRKFDEIVAFSGVQQFIDTPVKRYSSGMYVRLGFAVAAHLDPEILIVDEVLAVGDAEFQKKCLGKMADVTSEGRTVLFVSHNMSSVKNLCKTGFVIDGAKVSFSGDIEDCIATYLHADRSSSSLITDHIAHIHENIRLEQVLVNDQPYNRLMVKDSTKAIKISIEGEALEEIPLNLELRFRDSNGVPLGFYSPSQLNVTSNILERGHFNLSWEFNLPLKILRGEYYMEIALTDPGKKWWLRIPAAVTLEVDGLLDNKGEKGWIHL